jgi:hypothetical protein
MILFPLAIRASRFDEVLITVKKVIEVAHGICPLSYAATMGHEIWMVQRLLGQQSAVRYEGEYREKGRHLLAITEFPSGKRRRTAPARRANAS